MKLLFQNIDITCLIDAQTVNRRDNENRPERRIPCSMLDFGAARRFDPERIEAFRTLITATLDEDQDAVEAAAISVGYLSPEDDPEYRRAIVDMVTTAAEPARAQDAYDFGLEDLSERLSQQVIALRVEQGFGRLPPPDVLYLHRKLGGLYLLCKRLRARVRVGDLVATHLRRGTGLAGNGTRAGNANQRE